MPKLKILIMNGPNLSTLGQRRPDIYGRLGMDALPDLVNRLLGPVKKDIELIFFQSNSEGAMIDRLEEAKKQSVDGVVLNAGAYTHTSLALADCLEWIGIPCIEVHLSNVWSRAEEIRHKSLISGKSVGVIAGFGLLSYALAVQALLQLLNNGNS